MSAELRHPFVIGETYVDRLGAYKVVSLDGDQMVIEYADGTRKQAMTKIKAEIYSNIQLEKGHPRPVQAAIRTNSRNSGKGKPPMPAHEFGNSFIYSK